MVASYRFSRRGFSEDYSHDLPPCAETGAASFLRFRPNCREQQRSPQGRVDFITNEDGLRDLPKELLLSLPNRVLLLGDSLVEGYWLREDQAIHSRLRELEPHHYFINGGLRGSGPLFQARRLPELIGGYQPQEVITVLNETDITDDQLACAVAKDSSADPRAWEFENINRAPSWPERALGTVFRGTKFEARIVDFFAARRLNALIAGGAGKPCDPCAGLKSLKSSADAAKVQFRALVVDRGASAARELAAPAAAIETLQECLRELRVPFFAIRFEDFTPAEENKYLWGAEKFLNPLGVQYWAGKIHEAGAPLARN
ncbi:MAG: hypothetical protein EOP11_04070 [Proteobacteria bacterium]|nr:MAG: hypothetical protein EOP11_04070 [Pseudomonadota bacterium]